MTQRQLQQEVDGLSLKSWWNLRSEGLLGIDARRCAALI